MERLEDGEGMDGLWVGSDGVTWEKERGRREAATGWPCGTGGFHTPGAVCPIKPSPQEGAWSIVLT